MQAVNERKAGVAKASKSVIAVGACRFKTAEAAAIATANRETFAAHMASAPDKAAAFAVFFRAVEK